MDKYISLAKELDMLNALLISPEDIHFDIRTMLKCRWGCEDYFKESIKCHNRNTTYLERVEMIKKYNHILIVHAHEVRKISIALIELERIAFLDGYYFAFAIRTCNLCQSCSVNKGEQCPRPEKIRPCDQLFGIDVFKTARSLGLPCNVLKNKNDIQNRFGFLLID